LTVGDDRARREDSGSDLYWRAVRPNPPLYVTVAVAFVLFIIGLAGTLVPIPAIADLLAIVRIDLTRTVAYICLALAPTVLIVGSLVRGL
jgi:hypothetical protein